MCGGSKFEFTYSTSDGLLQGLFSLSQKKEALIVISALDFFLSEHCSLERKRGF